MTQTLCFIDVETTGLDPERHEIWEVACIIRTYIDGDDLEQVKEAGGDLEVASAYGENRHVWQLPVDLARADLIALNIGHFHERRWDIADAYNPITNTARNVIVDGFEHVVREEWMGLWAQHFAELTWGASMIGMVPSFDTERLGSLLRRHGACPGWHYQPVDVETLAVGSILGSLAMMDGKEIVSTAEDRGAEIGEDLHFPNRASSSRRFFMERAALPWDSERLSSWFGINPESYDRHTAMGDVEWARDLWDAIHESAEL